MFDKNVHNNNSTEKSDTDTIQEIAVKLVEEQESSPSKSKESTIFILGSKGVGKSTVFNRFFDREDNTRTTLALEYSYGRRTGAVSVSHPQQLAQKQVLNVWELGSLDNADKLKLIEVPLRTHGIENLAVIIMINLAQPQLVWLDLECAYRGLKQACNNILTKEELLNYKERLVQQRLRKEHLDINFQEVMPFSLIVVGGKYDVFMNFDPELKKHICRCLRSMTHLLGGALLFYSNQLPKLSKTLRDTISHLGFGSPANPFRQHITDYNEALTIWFGNDNWEQIGTSIYSSSTDVVERIGALLATEVPQLQLQVSSKDELSTFVDPAKDLGFRESVIDDIRSQMDEELGSIVRESQLRGQFEAVSEEYS